MSTSASSQNRGKALNSVAARSDDLAKAQQSKYHQFLQEILKEEANRYCADCGSKGPRWASHNLGVFLCIRCAGIHRNLGVHVSKVKSVNLDSWSEEQIEHMVCLGNRRAHEIYEAKLSDAFVRPQADSSLEAFIRGKYEHKKYCHEDWQQLVKQQPPNLLVTLEALRIDAVAKRRHAHDHASSDGSSLLAPPPAAGTKVLANSLTSVSMQHRFDNKQSGGLINSAVPSAAAHSAGGTDLLGIGDSSANAGGPTASKTAASEVDALGMLSGINLNCGNRTPSSTTAATASSASSLHSYAVTQPISSAVTTSGSSNMDDLIALSNTSSAVAVGGIGNMSHDSILSLFGGAAADVPSSSFAVPPFPSHTQPATFSHFAVDSRSTQSFQPQLVAGVSNVSAFHSAKSAGFKSLNNLQQHHSGNIATKAFDDLVKL